MNVKTLESFRIDPADSIRLRKIAAKRGEKHTVLLREIVMNFLKRQQETEQHSE